MATKRMLIDATHPEETRVVVVDGNRLEELEFESASRKQLKGNIYLAKVTRVEPSLQAAFVEYGGNRHGFLAFNEIHPDYYQIPVADREELEAETTEDETTSEDDSPTEDGEIAESGNDDSDDVEKTRPSYRNQRRYKIQEVIKKRQIILIQVVKEERGNKGAALTTYLSLAGRYCVLMPNTDKGGGISRKIANVQDRKRLKSVLSELSIPKGTAVIVRTAGAERSKSEIKRDYEYLMRLWSNIRDVTLQSQAPALIYEEANLIKRSIRDMYSRDIDEVLVEGEEGYRTAKDFMKMLIPSHAKKVQPYRDEAQVPLYHRYQVEGQLDAMHSPIVQLPSGGYIVINPTEALVAIDVNSGRSTKERNIEETALKTNLEAADEIARTLRLRDLAGLVVVDFIDMEVSRNQASVERRMKDAMKNDRARIQIGRISPFGLLEMSRQRLRPSFTESSTETCPVCRGVGVRRSLESSVLHVLRIIEEEGIRRRSDEIIVKVATDVALYILNYKREQLASIESRYQMSVTLQGDDSFIAPDHKLERVKAKSADDTGIRPLGPEDSTHIENIKSEVIEETTDEDEDSDEGRKRKRKRRPRKKKNDSSNVESEENAASEEENEDTSLDDDEDGKPRKRRRRGKRGGRRRGRRPEDEENADSEDESSESDDNSSEDDNNEDSSTDQSQTSDAQESDGEPSETTEQNERPRRRPRRRGLRRRRDDRPERNKTEDTGENSSSNAEGITEVDQPNAETPVAADPAPVAESESVEPPAPTTEEEAPAKPTRRRRTSKTKSDDETANTEAENATVEASTDEAVSAEKPKRRRAPRKKAAPNSDEATEKSPAPTPVVAETTPKTETKAEAPPVAEPKPEPKAPEAPKAVTITTTEGETVALASEDAPKKRGWWRRS